MTVWHKLEMHVWSILNPKPQKKLGDKTFQNIIAGSRGKAHTVKVWAVIAVFVLPGKSTFFRMPVNESYVAPRSKKCP